MIPRSLAILFIVLAAVLAFLIGQCSAVPGVRILPKIVAAPVAVPLIVRDTVIVERVKRATIIERAPARVVTRTIPAGAVPRMMVDTPYVARIDTVSQGDTIQVRFEHPERLFSILVQPRPDSLIYRNTVIQLPPIEVRAEPSLWEKLGYMVMGAGAGLVIEHGVIPLTRR